MMNKPVEGQQEPQAAGQNRQSPQQQRSSSEKPPLDKGLAYYPLSDIQFDLITIIYEKSKALQAYDKYLRDSQANERLFELLDRVRADDRKHVEMLKEYLGKI